MSKKKSAKTVSLPRVVPTLEPQGEEEFYYTSQELAALLGIAPSTLSGYRRDGSGPPFIHLGRRTVRYARKDVLAHIAENARKSTSENTHKTPRAQNRSRERTEP